MDVTALRQTLSLHLCPDITNAQRVRLLQHSGSISGLSQLLAQPQKPLAEPDLNAVLARLRRWCKSPPSREIERHLAQIDTLNLGVISIVDEDYPPLLRAIPSPPALLYFRGDLHCLTQPQLAIVGSRKASPAGLRSAREFSAAAAQYGLTVTSGLALGVDGEAHQATLSAGGKTVAVMAAGLDRIYPHRHQALADAVMEQGCLISEFALGAAPAKHHFPQRNRIISGLSLATLIVEASLPSGSLITAQTALAQGRDVLALPWSIYHAGGQGCLQLLQDGATLVRDFDDIVLSIESSSLRGMCRARSSLAIAASAETVVQHRVIENLTAHEQQLLSLVAVEPTTLEQLAECSTDSSPALLANLSALELKGLIERVGGAYVRT
ncbi:MAG: DNA-processing protein DprA [Halioglobus sp.]